MLIHAKAVEQKIHHLFRTTVVGNDKYKYYFMTSREYTEPVIDEDTWHRISMASVTEDNEVLGYYDVSINRQPYYIDSISLLSFRETLDRRFVEDTLELLQRLFFFYNFNKLVFTAAVNNPAISIYRKFFRKFEKEEAFVYRDHTQLYDGTLEDVAVFELHRDDVVYTLSGERTRTFKDLILGRLF